MTSGDPTRRGARPGSLDPVALERDVAAAQAGSVAAFERVYRALAPTVASYLRWHGAADVEASTNEVLAHVHRNLHRFAGDAAGFRSWVFTIAHHRMVDERRAVGRRPVTAGEVTEELVTGDGEADAMAAMGTGRLRELLELLSPDQRDVILLRVVADLSLEQTAAALGKRRGAVKSLQHRALAALRRALEREGTGA